MKVYERIKNYITEEGYFKNIVARNSQIENAKFSKIINGRVSLYVDDLIKIAKALEVDVRIFFEDKKEKERGK